MLMSRKRAASSIESSRSKRHLSGALAAELQSLRISRPAPRPAAAPHAFGTSLASSPFLSSNQLRRGEPAEQRYAGTGTDARTGIDMRASFADTLSQNGAADAGIVPEPDVLSPNSSSSSMALDEVKERECVSLRHVPGAGIDDIVIEDLDDSVDEENRVVVYKPPVRTSSQTFSHINARLPGHRYMARNPGTDEWVMKEARQDSMKRKMALVPWRGDFKKLRDAPLQEMAGGSVAIPMPWHDSGPSSTQSGSAMEIEDIS